jgi:nucleotide-binding universal stress UspA family protein
MIERIVLYIEKSSDVTTVARWALALAHRLDARVFVVGVMDPAGIPPGPDRDDRLSRAEETMWKALYEVEESVFEQDVKVSLLFEQGEPLEKLIEVCAGYEGQLVVVPTGCNLPVNRLLELSPVPVTFVNDSKED